MASELRVNTLKDASGNNSIATSFVAGGSAKAWLHYDQKDTIVVRASFNTSSVTDVGTGDFTINFTSSMSDGHYSPQMCSIATVSNLGFNRIYAVSTTVAGSVRMVHYEKQNEVDTDINTVTINGDLA